MDVVQQAGLPETPSAYALAVQFREWTHQGVGLDHTAPAIVHSPDSGLGSTLATPGGVRDQTAVAAATHTDSAHVHPATVASAWGAVPFAVADHRAARPGRASQPVTLRRPAVDVCRSAGAVEAGRAYVRALWCVLVVDSVAYLRVKLVVIAEDGQQGGSRGDVVDRV